jgi:hypothetical protein
MLACNGETERRSQHRGIGSLDGILEVFTLAPVVECLPRDTGLCRDGFVGHKVFGTPNGGSLLLGGQR